MLFTAPSIFASSIFSAKSLQALNWAFILVAAAVLLVVVILSIVYSVRYRATQSAGEHSETANNPRLEMAMAGVPLLLVAGFFFCSLHVLHKVHPPRGNDAAEVVIIGHQWWWEASYPASGVIAANEIHFPAGKRILIELKSADVIHDWWIPDFGIKMDMIPGRTNYLWIEPLAPGVYEGACSEFCGAQHAGMRIRVIAEDSMAYASWLSRQNSRKATTDSATLFGAKIFASASCGSCHNVHPGSYPGMPAPDLTHFGSRQTMLAGMLENAPAHLEAWLTDPQALKPGAHMPRFIFGADTVRALTAYLENLK